jgi:hypothetical protein
MMITTLSQIYHSVAHKLHRGQQPKIVGRSKVPPEDSYGVTP